MKRIIVITAIALLAGAVYAQNFMTDRESRKNQSEKAIAATDESDATKKQIEALLQKMSEEMDENPKSAKKVDVRLVKTQGTVWIKRKEVNEWKVAQKGMPIAAGDAIRTRSNSLAEVVFEGKALVQLENDTEATFEVLGLASNKLVVNQGIVTGSLGGILQSGESNFTIVTPELYSYMEGTADFAINSNPMSNITYIGVYNGSVSAAYAQDGVAAETQRVLKAGNEGTANDKLQRLNVGALSYTRRYQAGVEKFEQRLDFLAAKWTPMTEKESKDLRTKVFSQKSVGESAMPKLRTMSTSNSADEAIKSRNAEPGNKSKGFIDLSR